jgi:hypothetical protein
MTVPNRSRGLIAHGCRQHVPTPPLRLALYMAASAAAKTVAPLLSGRYGLLVVDVTPPAWGRATMLVRAVNENGTEIDRFTLSRPS